MNFGIYPTKSAKHGERQVAIDCCQYHWEMFDNDVVEKGEKELHHDL